MKNKLALAAFLFVFFASAVKTEAQTTSTEEIKWPQWAKDVRRFDVVSFGLFPFTYLVTTIGYDLYRSSQHNWDASYFPWPVKEIAGAFGVTGSGASTGWQSDDYKTVILSAAALSLSIAVVDLAVVWIKRAVAAGKAKAYEKPAIEIRRTPLIPSDEPAPSFP